MTPWWGKKEVQKMEDLRTDRIVARLESVADRMEELTKALEGRLREEERDA